MMSCRGRDDCGDSAREASSTQGALMPLTEDNLRKSVHTKFHRIVLRNAVTGQSVCMPGLSTKANDWTVPVVFGGVDRVVTAGDILGQLVYLVDPNGTVNSDGQQFRVSSVLISDRPAGFIGPSTADRSLELFKCASEDGVVKVVFGEQVVQFMDYDMELDRECACADDASTPRTPDGLRSEQLD